MATYTEHLLELRNRMRYAREQAKKFDREWNELNAKFKVKHREENLRRAAMGREPKSLLNMVGDKETSQAMKDALGAQMWWRDEYHAVASAILAEKAVHDALKEEW